MNFYLRGPSCFLVQEPVVTTPTKVISIWWSSPINHTQQARFAKLNRHSERNSLLRKYLLTFSYKVKMWLTSIKQSTGIPFARFLKKEYWYKRAITELLTTMNIQGRSWFIYTLRSRKNGTQKTAIPIKDLVERKLASLLRSKVPQTHSQIKVPWKLHIITPWKINIGR